jgi:hypothetical protein
MADTWPALPYEAWRDTLAGLRLHLQLLGRVRGACAPPEPDWAHIALFVTARGLTTGPFPVPPRSGAGLVELEADLLAGEVVARRADGVVRTLALDAPSTAAFHDDLAAVLGELAPGVALPASPQETDDALPFAADDRPRVFDGDAVVRFHRVLTGLVPALDAHRAAFAGRVTRTQFFWGSMDVTVARFTGSAGTADQHAVGFWPGDDSFPTPAFYAYAAPTLPGFEHALVAPRGAGWDAALGEFVLRYDDVRAVRDPAAAVAEFFHSTYAAAAGVAGWDPQLLA